MLPDTSSQPGTTGRLRSPVAALAAIVLACFALTAAVSFFVETPRIFYDELIYMEAAASLADGDGLQVRGEPYRYGALYPTVAAPVVALAGDREAAYALLKVLDSLLFALTAVPAYLLARRLLEAWPSVAVAALSVVVPSSVYVTVVMTESVAYFTATWALLAIVLAVERPTGWRQLAALVAVGVAVLARAQFVAVYAALLLALVIAHFLLPQRRRLGTRGGLRMLWPAAASLVLGLVLFVVTPVLRGGSPGDALGGYEHLLRGYDLATVGKWLVLHVAAFELYLAVIPVAVAPIVLSAYYARARAGSERYAAFVATFATVNAAALVSTAIAVTSQADPGFENPRLHDRYLFYVVPLWLIVLVWWVRAGAPRPRVATRIGIGLAALLALLFPYWQLELQDGVKLFSAVGTAFPAALEEIAGSALAGAIVTLALVGLLLAAVFRRTGVATKVVFGALVGVFLVNAVLVWGRAFNPPEGAVFPGSAPERRWVDERVPKGATVTMLESQCEDAILERDSYFLTEFFNDSIDDVVMLTENATGRVGADGTVVLSSGEELEARFVVAQPGLRLNGATLGQGTAAELVLWTVSAPVRIEGVEGPPAARRGFCLALPA